MYKSLEIINFLLMAVTIPKIFNVFTVEDLLKDLNCFFSSILCFFDGQFQCYITKLFLKCDHHAR